MYKKVVIRDTKLRINTSFEGETIEQKCERITLNKEPIKDGAPIIYTERKDGVEAGYNIRTDRFEIAVDAMDKVSKTRLANRDNKATMEIVKDVKNESTQGTDGGQNTGTE